MRTATFNGLSPYESFPTIYIIKSGQLQAGMACGGKLFYNYGKSLRDKEMEPGRPVPTSL
jgi:hypothetical protein